MANPRPVATTTLPPDALEGRLEQAIQPFLIAALVTALLLGPITMARLISGQALSILPAVVFFVALEGIYTSRWLADPDRRTMNRLSYRAAEFLVILLVLRILTWTVAGRLPTQAELLDYLLNPLAFFDGAFLFMLVLSLIAWERGVSIGYTFALMPLTEGEITYYGRVARESLNPASDERPPDLDRPALLNTFLNQWGYGAIILILFAAVTTFDVEQVVGPGEFDLRSLSRLGLHPSMLAAMIAYFLIGFWLASQARLAVMRVRWLIEGVTVEPRVARSWQRTSLILLLVIALLASLLPIGRTVGIARILEVFFGLGFLLVNAIFAVFAGLLYVILSLLMPDRQGEPPEAAMPTVGFPTIEAPPPAGGGPSYVFGGLFWLVAVAITILATLFFLRNRGYPISGAAAGRLWRSIAGWLRLLWRGLGGRVEELGQAIRSRLAAGRSGSAAETPPWRFVRLNALSPRDQIRYFYLATVRRAAERGVKRSRAETPMEYAQELKENWPEAQNEVEELTGAFVRARYSPRPIAAEDVSPVKESWKRVKNALRRVARR
jgi:hypothetical protein